MAKRTEEDEELHKRYDRYIRSKEWKQIAAKVMERDGYRCRCCGRTAEEAKLSVHHCTYENLFDESEHLTDLITVCTVCHLSIHRNRNNWQRFRISAKK